MDVRDPKDPGDSRRPPDTADGERRRGGCLLPLATAAAFYFILWDFATTPIAVLLASLGAMLAFGGIYLALGG